MAARVQHQESQVLLMQAHIGKELALVNAVDPAAMPSQTLG